MLYHFTSIISFFVSHWPYGVFRGSFNTRKRDNDNNNNNDHIKLLLLVQIFIVLVQRVKRVYTAPMRDGKKHKLMKKLDFYDDKWKFFKQTTMWLWIWNGHHCFIYLYLLACNIWHNFCCWCVIKVEKCKKKIRLVCHINVCMHSLVQFVVMLTSFNIWVCISFFCVMLVLDCFLDACSKKTACNSNWVSVYGCMHACMDVWIVPLTL